MALFSKRRREPSQRETLEAAVVELRRISAHMQTRIDNGDMDFDDIVHRSRTMATATANRIDSLLAILWPREKGNT